jgi:hypothetical protein
MADIRPRSNLEDYLDQIMNEQEVSPEPMDGPASFAQRFQGITPQEMLRQKIIEDLLQRHDDPVVYEELPPDQRSRSIRGAHNV